MVRGRLLLLNKRRPQSQWLRHQSQSPKIRLIYCHCARWFFMIGRGYARTQSATSMRLPLKVSGTCMTQRVTLCGSLVLLLQVSRQHTVILDPAQGWCVSPRDGSRQDACDWSPFLVKGLWLFHGMDILKFIMEEFYEWIKADISHEAQKEHVDAIGGAGFA